ESFVDTAFFMLNIKNNTDVSRPSTSATSSTSLPSSSSSATILAFVPPNDVDVLYKKIKANLDKNFEFYSNVVKLFEYLEETWIGRDVEKKTGRGRWTKIEIVHVKPMFEIELWNINSRINDCLPRTNNFVEAWHNAFSGMLCKHPSVYPLVDKFRYEQKKSEDLVVQLSTGVKYKRKPNYIVLDERIKEVVSRYSLDTFEKFYENLSLILDY
ncbi:unnamed protein product, partial [Brachionus calyciflorus]